MPLEDLVHLAPPPAFPIGAGDKSQWPVVEKALDIVLPEDYKWLVEIYGEGCFGSYIFLSTPSSKFRSLTKPYDILEFYDQYDHDDPDPFEKHCPYPPYPQPGGLLPWGGGDNAELLCWRTQGPASEWTLVILDNDYSDHYFEYAGSVTDFLIGWLSGTINVTSFPDDLNPQSEPGFRVLTKNGH